MKIKGWKKIFRENGNNRNNNKGGLATLISDKIDLKKKKL